MSLLSSRLHEIQPFHVMSLLRKSKELESRGRDIVHMEIGEPDFPTPTIVVEAGIRALQTGNVKYTMTPGLPELRCAIAQFYTRRYGVTVSSERIFVTPGGSGALLLAFAALVERGAEVLMADPCYPCNRNMIRLFDGVPRLLPVAAQRNGQLDLATVQNHWRESTRGVLIASPSNPTGTLIDSNEFRSIIEFVNAQGGFVLSDEIYHGLHYDQEPATALGFSDQVFVANSFSKYFGMTGWRIGWIVVPDSFVEPVERLAQNLFISAPSHSQLAALAAFDPENIAELERRREIFRERRDFMIEGLTRIGFEFGATPQGAFYIYANCERFSADSFELAERLLEDHGVAITPGKDFGEFRPQVHVRFAYTNSIERLAQGLDRLANALRC